MKSLNFSELKFIQSFKVFLQPLSILVLLLMGISTMKVNIVLSRPTTMMLQQLERQLPNVPMTRTVLQLKINGLQESHQSAYASERRENELEEGRIY